MDAHSIGLRQRLARAELLQKRIVDAERPADPAHAICARIFRQGCSERSEIGSANHSMAHGVRRARIWVGKHDRPAGRCRAILHDGAA